MEATDYSLSYIESPQSVFTEEDVTNRPDKGPSPFLTMESIKVDTKEVASRFGLAVRGRTSVRYRFGSPFSSKRLWFVDTVL